jgi:MATE family multidrug resistance protein
VRFAFLVNVGAHWLLGFPLSLALCFGVGLGARGLWIGITAGLVVTAVLLTARFLHLSRGNFSRV